jgi:hypothetical protein
MEASVGEDEVGILDWVRRFLGQQTPEVAVAVRQIMKLAARAALV